MSTNLERAPTRAKKIGKRRDGESTTTTDDGLIERKKGIAKMTRGRERRKATQDSRRRLMEEKAA